MLPGLYEKLKEEIEKNAQDSLLRDIELPLAEVLAHMENAGVAVDAEGIREYGEVLQAQIDRDVYKRQ